MRRDWILRCEDHPQNTIATLLTGDERSGKSDWERGLLEGKDVGGKKENVKGEKVWNGEAVVREKREHGREIRCRREGSILEGKENVIGEEDV